MYVDLVIPAGVLANGTPRQSRGRCRISHCVRWPDGTDMQPEGGWVQRGTDTVTGLARCIITWVDNGGTRWIAIGTHSNLYVEGVSASLSPITPVGFTSGRPDAASEGGYGSGDYGVGTFGTGRPDTENIQPASVWTLQTWGQDLVGVMADDGKLYLWTLNTSTPAAVVTQAPTGNYGVSVSQEDFLFLYNGRTITWSDQGDITDWTPSATNQAGDVSLNTEGRFKFGLKVIGAHLHFSDVDVWVSSYQGLPVVQGFQKAGKGAPISLGAAQAIDSRAVWMGRDGFYLYNGAISPMPSEVGDLVFKDFNALQDSKVTSDHYADRGEVRWHYPSAASNEIDSYVCWNYRYDHWTVGKVARTCGDASGIFEYPIRVDPAGVLWEHESGFAYPGAATPYAQFMLPEWPSDSGMALGEKQVTVRGLIPDQNTPQDCQVTFLARDMSDDDPNTFGPFASTSSVIDCMFSAREIEMVVTFTGMNDGRWGTSRIDVVPVSRR